VREQATGISQVTTAVSEMDKVTQQNAASSEESSAAATELEAQAQALSTMIRTFELGRAELPGTADATRPAPPPRRPGSARSCSAET
jgi:methyl-accepting chemotaxis protein